MASSSAPQATRTRSLATDHRAWVQSVAAALVIGAAFIALYVGLQRSPQPHQLPVAAVGAQVQQAASAGLGDKAAVQKVSSLEEGARLVRAGDVVAVVAATSPTQLKLEYAGASGFSESGAARQLVAGLASKGGFTVEESDIVPLAQYDSRGLSTFYVVFGVTLSSFVLAQGLTSAAGAVRLRHRLYAMAGFAVAIGVVAATIAGPLYGSLTPSFLELAFVLALLSLASAFATKALGSWLGPAGIALAVLILTTIGNATSGATIGYDLLPGWAQALSGKLPPGAAFRAINDLGYFDGSHAWGSLAVLAVWFVAGFGLVLLRPRLRDRKAREAALDAPALSIAN